MSRIDELLDKAVSGGITQEEARELKELIQKEASLKRMDERIKMLIAFGIGAAAGYALPRILELDHSMDGSAGGGGGAPVEKNKK
ncbi:MAG: hypothetical protein QXH42_04990 [Thermoplasmata archaeon]